MNNFKKLILKYEKIFVQFIKFGIVGLSNTLIYLLIYYVLLYFKVPYIIANALGFVISVINAYYWNVKFVFEHHCDKKIKSFVKVSLAYGGTFVLSTLLLYFFVKILGISEFIAPLMNLIITIPLNFVVIKFWALK